MWSRMAEASVGCGEGGPGFFLMVDSGGVECAFMVGHERIYKKKQAHSRPSHFEFPCMLTRLDYRVLFISQLCSKTKWTSVTLFRDTTKCPLGKSTILISKQNRWNCFSSGQTWTSHFELRPSAPATTNFFVVLIQTCMKKKLVLPFVLLC